MYAYKIKLKYEKEEVEKEEGYYFPSLIELTNKSLPTGPSIGKQIILGNYKSAVEIILAGNVEEVSENVLKARILYASGGVSLEDVYQAFPLSCVRERMVIKGLIRFGHDAYEEGFIIRLFINPCY